MYPHPYQVNPHHTVIGLARYTNHNYNLAGTNLEQNEFISG